jgi:hypothetical protein
MCRKTFCRHLEGQRKLKDQDPHPDPLRHGSADPDAHQNVMDPQHR